MIRRSFFADFLWVPYVVVSIWGRFLFLIITMVLISGYFGGISTPSLFPISGGGPGTLLVIIIIIEGLSLLQSIPPTTADKQTLLVHHAIRSGLGLSRCLGPGECLHSFIHSIRSRIPSLIFIINSSSSQGVL